MYTLHVTPDEMQQLIAGLEMLKNNIEQIPKHSVDRNLGEGVYDRIVSSAASAREKMFEAAHTQPQTQPQ